MATPQPDDGDNIPMQNLQDKETCYPALASVVASFSRMGMYKRFASLNSHSLLIRQAELIHLEVQLRNCISVDKEVGLKYHESVYDLMQAARAGGVDAEQWWLILEIRTKLDEYNAALLQQADMAKQSRPRKYDVNLLRDWLARPEGGSNFLGPDEDRPWLLDEEGDLVAVSPSPYDSLTHWIEERLVPWASHHGLLRKPSATGHELVGLVEWRERPFWAIAKAVSVIMSSAIPLLAILVLFLIETIRFGYWRRSL